MDISKIKKKEILKSPVRDWDKTTSYKEILIVPSNIKHDSGFMCIAVIGVTDNEELEICAYPDDINWDVTGLKREYPFSGMRTDCYYPSGILRFWGNDIIFEVGTALSSTDIKVKECKHSPNN
ncbi:MAG TPA: hypothetical protein VK469_16715 [Candidatus Kapabacteria bacterium]|nr:hypothetical protein [Candidatus Kapabacteria bacterium]